MLKFATSSNRGQSLSRRLIAPVSAMPNYGWMPPSWPTNRPSSAWHVITPMVMPCTFPIGAN